MNTATIPATAPTKKKQMRATASQITTAIASSAPIRSETSGESPGAAATILAHDPA